MSTKINNLNGNIAKVNSDINTRNNRRNVLDKLSAHLSAVKKNSQSVQKNQFFGVCLFYSRMTVSHFQSLFRSNEEFAKYIYAKHDVISPNSAGTIVQIFANIPEITGMLPEVNIQKMQDLINLNSTNPTTTSSGIDLLQVAPGLGTPRSDLGTFDDPSLLDEAITNADPAALVALDRAAQFQSNLDARASSESSVDSSKGNPITNLRNQLTLELDKTSMYPRFYLYTETNYTPSVGQILLFEFPSLKGEYLPTMAMGAFERETKDTIDLFYPKPKKESSPAPAPEPVPATTDILRGSPRDGTESLGADSITTADEALEAPEVILTNRAGMTPRPSRAEREREREENE
jgi:hypothetical protein